MKLSEAIKLFTSGDQEKMTLEEAERGLAEAKKAQDRASSDWGYWEADDRIAAWTCLRNLIEACQIAETDEVPGPPMPEVGGMRMDRNANFQDWSKEVLKEAKEAEQNAQNP